MSANLLRTWSLCKNFLARGNNRLDGPRTRRCLLKGCDQRFHPGRHASAKQFNKPLTKRERETVRLTAERRATIRISIIRIFHRSLTSNLRR